MRSPLRALEVLAGASVLAAGVLKLTSFNGSHVELGVACVEVMLGAACLLGRWPRLSGPLLIALATALLMGGPALRGAHGGCGGCACLGALRLSRAGLLVVASLWLAAGGLLTILRPWRRPAIEV